jgi:hypothetical protein
MNYYIIPKNNFNINIDLKTKTDIVKPYISYSLIFYLNDIYTQIFKIQNQNQTSNNGITGNQEINSNDKINYNEEITIDYINKIVNPFEFIHTNVPGSIISVSKVKPDSNIFFELMEIFQLFNVNEIIGLKHKINIAHLTHNHTSTNYLLNMLREDNEDNIICEDFNYETICNLFITNNISTKLDLIICEFSVQDYNDTNKYIKNMLLIFAIIIKYQSNQGTCIIKIDNIFYKPIVDILFMLSALYEKVYLIKPIISNITKGERYIICKTFNSNVLDRNYLLKQTEEHICHQIRNHFFDKQVYSVINNDIPYYFLNKLEESNSVIGQQQLEAYDQIINIFKNKNRDDKIETLKRNHIQKCIQWCEKNQLPHNKFIDKINIFLTTKKKEIEIEMVEKTGDLKELGDVS